MHREGGESPEAEGGACMRVIEAPLVLLPWWMRMTEQGREGNTENPGGGVESNIQGPEIIDPNGQA